MRLAIVAAAVTVLAGCATSHDVEMARAHYEAQSAQDRPLLHLAAHPGQTIELRGVRELTVHAPADDVTPYRRQHHPAWGILGSTLQAALPLVAAGHYSVRLADTVGEHAGDLVTGSHNTDASDRSTEQRWSNRGRIDSPDDSTHPPVIADPVVVEQPEPTIVEQPAPLTGGSQ